jgi:hypothetical protein
MNNPSDSMVDKITEMLDNLVWIRWQTENETEIKQSKAENSKTLKRSMSRSPTKSHKSQIKLK